MTIITEEDHPQQEPKNDWGRLDLVFENHSKKGCQYFGRLNGNGQEAPISEKELMYMGPCQQWYLRHFHFVPPDMTKPNFNAWRDAVLARAVERVAEVGLKPEEQAAVVVMKVLQRTIPHLQHRRDNGQSFEGELGELMEIEGEDYVIIGEQTLHVYIKQHWIDERYIGTRLDQRQVGDCLKAIPGCEQFNRGNGKSARWAYLPSNLDRRSKYAVPVKSVQAYKTV
jgi:hypothetical protein